MFFSQNVKLWIFPCSNIWTGFQWISHFSLLWICRVKKIFLIFLFKMGLPILLASNKTFMKFHFAIFCYANKISIGQQIYSFQSFWIMMIRCGETYYPIGIYFAVCTTDNWTVISNNGNIIFFYSKLKTSLYPANLWRIKK